VAPDDPLASPVGLFSMMNDHGTVGFNYKGLVWDGSGKAAVGVDHFGRTLFSSWMMHRFEAFLNFKVAGVRVREGSTEYPSFYMYRIFTKTPLDLDRWADKLSTLRRRYWLIQRCNGSICSSHATSTVCF
jgi:hypothetical protein